ncbi:MAG: DUF4136 domain-containing protein [Dyadobacter sp.]|uniref:DUF4136 domain-containing protein n=1 Tax=Dyadobacter sp. TaxID=1914288 RepID=UPI001B292043|nr:DUF4136 domain-containing protein [Dyadobacter sp.]MBO9611275.1 DUF4136 domain-containing protein [Dyadobacter sp.]
MRTITIALLSTAVLIMAGCASVKVDQVDSAHLTHYKKYAWVKPEENTKQLPQLSNSITEENIRAAVKNEFTKKGITEDEQNPDLLLMYHIFTTQKTENVPNPPVYPYYGYGFGPRAYYFHGQLIPIAYAGYYNPWNTGYHQEHYTDGTLIIDVIDAKTNELLWRGSMENPVNDAGSLSKQFAKEAMQILGKYPDVK